MGSALLGSVQWNYGNIQVIAKLIGWKKIFTGI
jgi:hypothetical protein